MINLPRFGYKIVLIHLARVDSSQTAVSNEFEKIYPDINQLSVDLKNEKYENQVNFVDFIFKKNA